MRSFSSSGFPFSTQCSSPSPEKVKRCLFAAAMEKARSRSGNSQRLGSACLTLELHPYGERQLVFFSVKWRFTGGTKHSETGAVQRLCQCMASEG